MQKRQAVFGHAPVAVHQVPQYVQPVQLVKRPREHEKGQDLSKVPGQPGVDYPIFHSVPPTNFHCGNVPAVPGIYANVETGCQVNINYIYCTLTIYDQARRGGSDGSMPTSGSAGPGFDSRLGSKFSSESFQPRG